MFKSLYLIASKAYGKKKIMINLEIIFFLNLRLYIYIKKLTIIKYSKIKEIN